MATIHPAAILRPGLRWFLRLNCFRLETRRSNDAGESSSRQLPRQLRCDLIHAFVGRRLAGALSFCAQSQGSESTNPVAFLCRWTWQRGGEIVRILLVEDSKPMRRENEHALLDAGYEVVCAVDGECAVRFAQDLKPDLILLDMILPKLSGPEVLKRLKSDPGTAEIPVVVLSSLSEKNRQKLMEAGAEEYLEKNEVMALHGMNLLPKMLENIICRINRKRGIPFSSVPVKYHSDFPQVTASAADVPGLRDWRQPEATSPRGTPRTSCSPKARRGRTLPENSTRAARRSRRTSKTRRAIP